MEGSLCCVFVFNFGSLSVLCQAKPKAISFYLQNKENLRLTCASFILLQSVNGSYIFTANILAKSAPQHTTLNTVLFLQSFSLGVSKTWLKNAKAGCNWKLNIKQVENIQKINANAPGQSYKYKEHTQEQYIYLIEFFVEVKKKQSEKLFQQIENDWRWLLQKVALC